MQQTLLKVLKVVSKLLCGKTFKSTAIEVEITNKDDWTATSLNELRSHKSAAQAIDGTTAGEPFTSDNEKYSWFQVIIYTLTVQDYVQSQIDLGASHNISKVKMVTRVDIAPDDKNQNKFAQFEIRVGMTPAQGKPKK